jgi:hypothetical protein
VERRPSANFPAQCSPRIKKEEDFIKMLSLSKLFIARTLLFATIISLSAPAQLARSTTASSVRSAGSSVILCQPGLVFKCTKLGCFCVKP